MRTFQLESEVRVYNHSVGLDYELCMHFEYGVMWHWDIKNNIGFL